MLDRFYAPTSLDQPSIELPEEEAHHLARVLRKRVGDQVCVFDGVGGAAVAQVELLGRNRARLAILFREPAAPTTGPVIVLATAVPKGDRARWLVEKATELGVDQWIPLLTERTVVDPGARRLEQLRQTVIAACKQSRRNRLLEISACRSWSGFLADIGGTAGLVVADPSGTPVGEAISRHVDGAFGRVAAAVGPEGGFTAGELDSARAAGAAVVALGPQVLRTETAGIVVATLLTCATRGR